MKIKIDLTQGKKKTNLYFISDFHLFHERVIIFDNRPFENIEAMHTAIIDGWNKVVGPEDIVIYLGDLSFSKAHEKKGVADILNKLNGVIHFVMGNHDDFKEIKNYGRFQTISDYLELSVRYVDNEIIKRASFCCSHYPIYSWNKAHHGSYMVHGHCHGNLHHGEDASFYKNRRVIDVGCMLHNYEPVSFYKIIEQLQNLNTVNITSNL